MNQALFSSSLLIFFSNFIIGTLENLIPMEDFLKNLENCKSYSDSCSTQVKIINWNGNSSGCSCQESAFNQFREKQALGESLENSKPRMLCRTPTRLTFQWAIKNNAKYFAVYLQEHGDQWRFLIITTNNLLTIEKLLPATKYRAKIQVIYSDGLISPESDGNWIFTLQEEYVPGDIKDISIIEWFPKNKSINGMLSWKPAIDYSCYYEVIWHQELDYFTKIIKKPEELHFTYLNDLRYDMNYSIAVCGIYENRRTRIEGNKHWQIIKTPKCLEMNNKSLTICPPEKLKNLRVEEEVNIAAENVTFYNVRVEWDLPEVIPELITVVLEKLELGNPSYMDTYKNKILGDKTEFIFENIELGSYYRVRVWATSPGGSSGVSEEYRQLKLESYRYSEEIQNDLSWRVFILSPILGIFALFLSTILVYYRIKVRLTKKKEHEHLKNLRSEDIEKHKRDLYGEEFEDFVNDEYEIPLENILIEEVLGEGAFGVVRKGILKKNSEIQEVAVKMLREKPTRSDIIQFRQEIDMLKAIGKHPNIVSLIGCCTRSSNRMLLVVEYCSNGDLRNYLQKIYKDMIFSKNMQSFDEKLLHSYENCHRNIAVNRLYEMDVCREKISNDTSATDLLSFARQVAIGMEFLALNRVVHRDVAARNVLVCKNKTVKISDFGLSRDVYERNFYIKGGDGKVPVKWMALESLIYQKYTTQSDVWSFGVLLWEIVTFGAVPYPGVPSTKIVQLLTSGYRMARPSNCSQELYDIMLSCWKAKPCERPTFTELRRQLDTILENSSSVHYIDLETSCFDYLLPVISPTQNLTLQK